MSAQNEIDSYELKLESIIKSAFEKVLRLDDDFEISADYDTHRRIEDVVEGLGLTVYGMSVTPSEFTITFEFDGAYRNMECFERPTYCHISLRNDGEYSFNISNNDLKNNWDLKITDHNFNIKLLTEETILETLKEMNQVLLVTVLSN
jgi:hypothetical protein